MPYFPKEGQACTRADPAKCAACKKPDEVGECDECKEDNPCTSFGIPVGTYTCGDRPDQDRDSDLRSAGLNPKDMLKWRWLCATGVYHAAGNTLSVEAFRDIAASGTTAEEYLCKRSNVWGEGGSLLFRTLAALCAVQYSQRYRCVAHDGLSIGACLEDASLDLCTPTCVYAGVGVDISLPEQAHAISIGVQPVSA